MNFGEATANGPDPNDELIELKSKSDVSDVSEREKKSQLKNLSSEKSSGGHRARIVHDLRNEGPPKKKKEEVPVRLCTRELVLSREPFLCALPILYTYLDFGYTRILLKAKKPDGQLADCYASHFVQTQKVTSHLALQRSQQKGDGQIFIQKMCSSYALNDSSVPSLQCCCVLFFFFRFFLWLV